MGFQGAVPLATLERWYELRYGGRKPADELLPAIALAIGGLAAVFGGLSGIVLTGGMTAVGEPSTMRVASLLGASFGVTATLTGLLLFLPDEIPTERFLVGAVGAVAASVLFAYAYPAHWGPNSESDYRVLVGVLWTAGHGILMGLVLQSQELLGSGSILGPADPDGSDRHGDRERAGESHAGSSSADRDPDDADRRQPTAFEASLHTTHFHDLGKVLEHGETLIEQLDPDQSERDGGDSNTPIREYLRRVDGIGKDMEALRTHPAPIRERHRELVDRLDTLCEVAAQRDSAVDVAAIELHRDRISAIIERRGTEPIDPRQHSGDRVRPRRPQFEGAPARRGGRPISRHAIDTTRPHTSRRPGRRASDSELPIKFTLLVLGIASILLIGLYIEIG